jgi:hypothetical protein
MPARRSPLHRVEKHMCSTVVAPCRPMAVPFQQHVMPGAQALMAWLLGTCLVQAGPAVAGAGRLLLPARRHGDFRPIPAPQHTQRVDRPPVSSAKREFWVLSITLNVNNRQGHTLLGCQPITQV